MAGIVAEMVATNPKTKTDFAGLMCNLCALKRTRSPSYVIHTVKFTRLTIEISLTLLTPQMGWPLTDSFLHNTHGIIYAPHIDRSQTSANTIINTELLFITQTYILMNRTERGESEMKFKHEKRLRRITIVGTAAKYLRYHRARAFRSTLVPFNCMKSNENTFQLFYERNKKKVYICGSSVVATLLRLFGENLEKLVNDEKIGSRNTHIK